MLLSGDEAVRAALLKAATSSGNGARSVGGRANAALVAEKGNTNAVTDAGVPPVGRMAACRGADSMSSERVCARRSLESAHLATKGSKQARGRGWASFDAKVAERVESGLS